MARETIFKCDKCGKTDDVRTWKLTCMSESWEIELCSAHWKPLMEIAKLGREVANGGAGRRAPDQTYDRMVRPDG